MERMRMMILTLCLLGTATINAQFDFGVQFGLSSQDLEGKSLTYAITDNQKFTLHTNQARYGIQLGAFALLQHGSFFVMPEAYFHSRKYEYSLDQLNSLGEVVDIVRSEKMQSFDMVILMGVKKGFFRAGLGPVCTLHLDNVSQLWAQEGYDQAFDSATWGLQGGVGIDIFMIHLDLRYQFDFSRYGSHIEFFGKKAELSPYAGVWSLKAGYSF